jgi:hypothetical protein
MIRSFLGLRQFVRIMARYASQLFFRADKAPARLHLFNLAGKPEVVRHCPGPDINRNKILQGKSRSEIKGFLAKLGYSTNPLEMTLLANRLAQLGFQTAWIDNCFIGVARARGCRPPLNMQGAGAVATFTADGFYL